MPAIEQECDSLRKEWNLRSEKVKRVRSALAIETVVTVKFQLEQQLLEEEAHLAHLSAALAQIEQALAELTKK